MKHRGLAILTLLIVGLSCPAIGASAAGSPTPRQLTIAVPSSASTGERYGVVWAELPPTPA